MTARHTAGPAGVRVWRCEAPTQANNAHSRSPACLSKLQLIKQCYAYACAQQQHAAIARNRARHARASSPRLPASLLPSSSAVLLHAAASPACTRACCVFSRSWPGCRPSACTGASSLRHAARQRPAASHSPPCRCRPVCKQQMQARARQVRQTQQAEGTASALAGSSRVRMPSKQGAHAVSQRSKTRTSAADRPPCFP